MSPFNAVEITEEEFLRAKRIICEGIGDLAFLTTFMKNLRIYIGTKFDVREDPEENPFYEGMEIKRKYKILMYVKGEMTPISIDEFFFLSIQKWDPNTAKYLTFAYNLLRKYHALTPVKMTTEQKVHWRQLKYLINVVKSIKPELDFKNLSIEKKLQVLDQYLPEEYKGKLVDIIAIYQPAPSLNTSIDLNPSRVT